MSALLFSEADALFDYEPETGALRWKISPSRNVCAGDVAGSKNNRGYLSVKVKKKTYAVHRLCWLLHYGSWPDGAIDHKNGIAGDNRIENLRIATPTQNNANTRCRSDSRTGLKGTQTHHGSYRARIMTDGVLRILGTFQTAELAHAAYFKAAQQAFGEYARAA